MCKRPWRHKSRYERYRLCIRPFQQHSGTTNNSLLFFSKHGAGSQVLSTTCPILLVQGECVTVPSDGWCVWITGLPGSGKSVVSEALLILLEKEDIHAQLLSSDALRKVLTPKPTYSLEERNIVYATLVYIAKLLTQNGVGVIIDSTGNLRCYRESARKQIPNFMEAYLNCPLTICMEREARRRETYDAPKLIYAKAMKSKSSTVPGVGQSYESPINPEIAIDTTRYTPEQVAQKIFQRLLEKFQQAES